MHDEDGERLLGFIGLSYWRLGMGLMLWTIVVLSAIIETDSSQAVNLFMVALLLTTLSLVSWIVKGSAGITYLESFYY